MEEWIGKKRRGNERRESRRKMDAHEPWTWDVSHEPWTTPPSTSHAPFTLHALAMAVAYSRTETPLSPLFLISPPICLSPPCPPLAFPSAPPFPGAFRVCLWPAVARGGLLDPAALGLPLAARPLVPLLASPCTLSRRSIPTRCTRSHARPHRAVPIAHPPALARPRPGRPRSSTPRSPRTSRAPALGAHLDQRVVKLLEDELPHGRALLFVKLVVTILGTTLLDLLRRETSRQVGAVVRDRLLCRARPGGVDGHVRQLAHRGGLLRDRCAAGNDKRGSTQPLSARSESTAHRDPRAGEERPGPASGPVQARRGSERARGEGSQGGGRGPRARGRGSPRSRGLAGGGAHLPPRAGGGKGAATCRRQAPASPNMPRAAVPGIPPPKTRDSRSSLRRGTLALAIRRRDRRSTKPPRRTARDRADLCVRPLATSPPALPLTALPISPSTPPRSLVPYSTSQR